MKNALKYVLTWMLVFGVASCAYKKNHDRDAHNPLAGMAPPLVVASGFLSTEGPIWHPQSNSLLFSDIPGNTIYSLNTDSHQLATIRTPSSVSNGLALDNEGYLLAAEQESRTISRMDLRTGDISPFIDSFNYQGEDRAFNSPNDIAVFPDGSVYFTDPPFGLQGRDRELDFNGVFVRSPDGSIQLLKALDANENPNGIIFNPDYSVLYLAVSDDQSGPIWAYDVSDDGSLSNEREFSRAQNSDGMAMDIHGNLYVATRTGVRVWSPQGHEWGWIRLPGNLRTTNVAFAGKAMNTLYITNRSGDLYAIELDTVGHQ